MDDQGGAGGAPLHHDEGEAERRKPHVDRPVKAGPAKGGEPPDRRFEHGEREHDRDREGRSPAKGPE
ncbi:hypothetical protein ABZ934_00425 [Streptomyces sp. NPDC046557]|uniref:hypothetical protein n=1 Tax=Streptomyces sp. NPDC046557 TaxID=3155372 RepID=UPI0033E29A2D